MSHPKDMQWQLTYGAWLLICLGLYQLGLMAKSIVEGDLSIQLGSLVLIIGVGLLGHNPLARLLALGLYATLAPFLALAAISAYIRPIPVHFYVLERQHAEGANSMSTAELTTLVCFTFMLWQLWVLTRPSIKTLFVPTKATPSVPTVR